MKYTLNESMVGINGIEKISLKEITEKFSYPKNIKIKSSHKSEKNKMHSIIVKILY